MRWWIGALFLIVASATARAAPAPSACTFDGNECTPTEAYVLDAINRHEAADLTAHCADNTTDTRQPATAACALIRTAFLRWLLTDHTVSGGWVAAGVKIVNALVCDGPKSQGQTAPAKQSFDLSNIHVTFAVELRHAQFCSDVALGGARFEQGLALDDSIIDGKLQMYALQADAGLTASHITVSAGLEGDSLKSNASVNFFQARVGGMLHLRGAVIAGDLDLGQLDFSPAPLTRPLNSAVAQRQSIKTPRSEIDISNARIGHDVYLTGAKINGDVDLGGLSTEGSVMLEAGTVVDWGLSLERANIGDSLMMGQGQFNTVDLTEARIGKELRLESDGKPTVWKGQRSTWVTSNGVQTRQKVDDQASWLVLSNAHIDAIRDTFDAWPDCLSLNGLVYRAPPHNYAGVDPKQDASGRFRWCYLATANTYANTDPLAKASPLSWDLPCVDWTGPYQRSWLIWCRHAIRPELQEPRSAAWWRNWLERDPGVTIQPYVQLATALRTENEAGRADSVQFEARVFERKNAGTLTQLLNRTEELLTGFGIGTYGVLFTGLWLLFAVTLATYFLCRRMRSLLPHTGNGWSRGKLLLWSLAASLQTALPFVTVSKRIETELDEPLDKDDPHSRPLAGGLLIGFSTLALFGLVLGAFLLHGLSHLIDQ